LFCWKTLANFGKIILAKQCAMTFQSLFCWKTLANLVGEIEGLDGQMVVSILVLLEDPRQRGRGGGGVSTAGSFNPCFAGRPSPTLSLFGLRLGNGDVSILVLLEDPRQLKPLALFQFFCGSFNPCFAGRPSPTKLVYGEPPPPGVSILVLLEDPRQPFGIFSRRIDNIPSFNPCFAGRPSPTQSCPPIPNCFFRFNPCFAGRPSPTVSMVFPFHSVIRVFQSLFCWKTLANLAHGRIDSQGLCFNPCFAGRPSPVD